MRSPLTATAPSSMGRRSGSMVMTVPSITRSTDSGIGTSSFELLTHYARTTHDAAGAKHDAVLRGRGQSLLQRSCGDGHQVGGRARSHPGAGKAHHSASVLAHQSVGRMDVELAGEQEQRGGLQRGAAAEWMEEVLHVVAAPR